MKLRLNDDEIRLVHDFEEDCMDDLSRKKSLSQADSPLKKAAERSYTWRNEDYTSITDTIMVPDPEHYHKGSEQSISSPNLSRTSCGNSRALRNFEEVICCSNKLWLEDEKPAQTEDR
ncbi:unnamed protein product [Gongylonema pulchrum]|uniref:Uncharacterized protein n=2 Tax=Gongylonema pulchrum TaxID=637853 RepID=A0A183EBW1_9BILA|nr:unnamed protein product [Gongylonema pulchrum]